MPDFKKIDGFEDINHIRRKINQISTLAPLPLVIQAVMEISEDPSSSAASLGKVIKKDQTLTAKILKIVNSAYFGFYRRISNIDQAIVILGFDEIKNITIATSLMTAFNVNFNYVLNREGFWMHSLGAAFIARSLCSTRLELNAEDAFVVGLTHDIGKLVLLQNFNQAYSLVIFNSAEHIVSLPKVEKEMINIDHAEIGGALTENWKLPRHLVRAIELHHAPEKAEQDESYVHIAHLANYFCHKYEIGKSSNPVPDEVSPHSLKALGLRKDQLEEIWGKIKIDQAFIRDML